MHSVTQARRALAAVDLVQGLSVSDVHTRLEQGVRLRDTGQRILAFYLVEMADRRLHQETGHATTALYAEGRLGLDRRRTAELIAVGRTLLELPAIDAAFCDGRIGWSKTLLLARVATPDHEAAWLERALALPCRALALDVKLARPGSAPRAPGDRKGLPEIRFPVRASVGALTHRKLDLAKQKLSAERGAAVNDAELLDVMAELFLEFEEKGEVEGRERVSASLYRIVLRSEDGDPEGGGAEGGGLVLDADEGPIPVGGSEVDSVRCDAEHAGHGGHGDVDRKTPPALRRRVLARDGHRCRCCGSRHRLMVHHIRFRSHRGRTCGWNLITLCVSCHALVHDGLLVLEGERERDVRYVDRKGRSLHEPGGAASPTALGGLTLAPRSSPRPSPRPSPCPSPIPLDAIPEEVDGAWWARHAPQLRCRGDGRLEWREDAAPRAVELVSAAEAAVPELMPVPAAREEPFAGLVGQDDLLARLEAAARGSRARGRPFPHTLFVGPAGTGKTTLARGVAALAGARLHAATGPLLPGTHALVGLLAGLGEGDVLFLDEIHAVPRAVLETLYQALAERHLTLTLHAGTRARTVRLALPAFTLVAATTEDGDLPNALRGRFGLRETLGYYADESLAELVSRGARREGVDLRPGVAERLAHCARGTPREALRLFDRVLDDLVGRETGRSARVVVRAAEAEAALRRLGYDRDGLDPSERRYLELLRESPVPIPLARLSRMLGTSARTLLRHLEPFLFRRGLVQTTPRGRVAVTRPRLLEA